MAAITAAEFPEVIDLVSDDSDEAESGPSHGRRRRTQTLDLDDADNLAFYETIESAAPSSSSRGRLNEDLKGEVIVLSDGEEVFIIDDEDPAERAETFGMPSTIDTTAVVAPEPEVTPESCLQLVLEIFPDVSHDHVLHLYDSFEAVSDKTKRDNIIEKLVSDPAYPKQERQSQKKRKRAASTDDSDAQRWEKQDREVAPGYLKGTMQAILKVEYPEMTVKYINETFALEKHLYQAYVALAAAKDNPDPLNQKLNKGRPSVRHFTTADAMATNSGWPPLLEELAAARKSVQGIRTKKALENEKKKEEAENLRLAMERGETAECSACFDDLPMNRQVHCDGLTAHFTCYDCITAYIKSEVGESRCRLLCPSGCGAGFAPNQLNVLEDKQLLEKFAELEQEKAIRDAGLEDLAECPFCDYKAILPPIEEDFEFRCANPECEEVSCRRCKSVSHIPMSCEQYAKENRISSRHKIEEAMTAAMIRSCNRCKKQFIKEYGCNKMTCPSCHNMQCYCCSQTLKDYDHFDQAPLGRSRRNGKKCPLYDDVEVRHEREVKEAEEAAKKELMEENPDLNAEDLEIKISDRVKQAEAEKAQRAGPARARPAMVPLQDILNGGDGFPDVPFQNLQGLGRAPWLNGRGGDGLEMWPPEPPEPLRELRHAPPAGQPAQIVEPAMQALLPPHYGRMGNAPAPAENDAEEGLAAFAFGHIRPHVRGVLDNAPAPAPAGNAADQGMAAFAYERIHHRPHVRDAAQAPHAHAQAMQQQQQRPETPHAAPLAYDRARREQLLHQIGQRLQMPEEFLAAPPPPPNPTPPRDHPAPVPEVGLNRVREDAAGEEVLRQRAAIRAHVRRQQMRLRMQVEQLQQLRD
ncbi:hypothetical protein KC343_g7056 [Hortaea werneckii]|uniref:RING-type domain-containing protein n=1 Tax=Hortaea werneckii TaxID=91943 RepID=A0A3M7EU53_HORWE|nr:hypothetical protein KC352_g10708 [Hortaea werneckii]KAI7563605.1 hypothetical protein KC317_g7622 [Hortaea werneckii]KAI7614343.1 hypothetical protein KC346_g6966 [Hortaea werneckii]KAI7624236.1 hypothetical protein KC343_g7056 [Hortaea werneckii]KAI7665101.1 hypothetical protein KC319_g7303 [Hortaea werneckii]